MICSLFFAIPLMVLYYGSGPYSQEAGNIFNNFLSGTTISNIGSGVTLMNEAVEGEILNLNCPSGSSLYNFAVMYGEPYGEIDCPAIQQRIIIII